MIEVVIEVDSQEVDPEDSLEVVEEEEVVMISVIKEKEISQNLKELSNLCDL